MNQAEFTLDQAPIGQPVRVVAVDGDAALVRRLADLGLRAGVAVECLRRAPLGDPSVFELCGYQLCLRRTESGRVRVVGDVGRDVGGEVGADVGATVVADTENRA